MRGTTGIAHCLPWEAIFSSDGPFQLKIGSTVGVASTFSERPDLRSAKTHPKTDRPTIVLIHRPTDTSRCVAAPATGPTAVAFLLQTISALMGNDGVDRVSIATVPMIGMVFKVGAKAKAVGFVVPAYN